MSCPIKTEQTLVWQKYLKDVILCKYLGIKYLLSPYFKYLKALQISGFVFGIAAEYKMRCSNPGGPKSVDIMQLDISQWDLQRADRHSANYSQ